MIKQASVLDKDPADALAVQVVCTACHTSSQFLSTPRSSTRWEQVFADMTGYGADPTDEQVDRIVRYFQENLMVVNANLSPAEELGPTLQVGDSVAAAIVARRAQRKFTGLADLETVPGLDPKKLVILQSKNLLQF